MVSSKGKRSTDLGVLQTEAENAAKVLKGARTAAANAKAAMERAEEIHAIAQKALTIGMEQVKAATKA